MKTVYSLAVDIGGTFTDIVLRASDGSLTVDKTLTTPRDLLEGFFTGVNAVLRRRGISPGDINGVIVHATTIVTNALIERKGSPTAMLVTEGFRDLLIIRNEHRYDMYDPQIEFAPPLVARELTFGIAERTFADGTVLAAPDPASIDRAIEAMRAQGIRSVAVCLLNSYANPANEQAVAARLHSALPDLLVSLSSAIAPQVREYPRASTTAINAYTMPVSQPYLQALARRLGDEGYPNEPLIMLSSGGIIGAEIAGRNPVRMMESGPAAGALAASYFAERLALDRLMSFDMGGTTAKACLIEHGRPRVTGLLEVDRKYRFKEGSGMPVTIPSIDMIEIGAGGGSIAHVDALGLLKVGPESAGADPGPACYGRGGTEACVTDADLVLGLLDADHFLGGDMPLDLGAAANAVQRLGERLGTGIDDTARGIYRIVSEAMAAATRAHATDRGVDYRGLALLAFGGAGPVHACEVGSLLMSRAVIFPPEASVLSAFGTLVTPVRLDLVRSALGLLDAVDWSRAARLIGDMEREGREALQAAGVAPANIRISFGADLRYFGQQNEVSVELPSDPRVGRDPAPIHAGFERAYCAQFGFNPDHVAVEVVTWRLTAHGPGIERVGGAQAPVTPDVGPGVDTGAPGPPGPPGIAAVVAPDIAPRSRRVTLWERMQVVPVHPRRSLTVGQGIDGPALIEERETTIVIPPGWRAVVDRSACIIATPREG